MWLAVLIMMVGLINLTVIIDRERFVKGQIIRLLIGLPLTIAYVYLVLPAVVPRVGWSVIAFALLVNAVITLLEAAFGRKRRLLLGSILAVAALLIPLTLNLVVPLAAAKQLQQVPEVEVASAKIEAVDVDHIRLVPYENALWKAQKVIGNLGNTYKVGELSIQRVDNHLYWVAPLEFRGFFKWLQAKTSPGYILVDAEDPQQPAVLKTGYQMRYLPSAYFNSDLKRHIYGRFATHFLAGASFEIDDNYRPWFVMSLTRPTVGLSGEKLAGVVLIDPASGEMTRYDLDQVPSWVDQVVPEQLAERYNTWYGKYRHGFLNSIFAQRDVHVPTGWGGQKADVFGVIGADSRFYWFTGHTSPSASDDSLVGYMMMDGVTGRMTYYPHANGYFNEQAAVSTVNSKVSNYSGWHGAQPIFYNIYGVETWIVPVLAENNNLVAIGVVHAKTGDTVIGESKREALLAYKRYLANSGASDYVPTQEQEMRTLTGTVSRVQRVTEDGNTVVYLQVTGTPVIFTARASLSPELALTQAGDTVTIQYLDTDENVVSIMSFENHSIR